MVDDELIEILICPDSGSPVRRAEESIITKINAAIEKGALLNNSGEQITEKIDEGLIREDGKLLYLVRDDIPVMIPEEAIVLPLGGE